MTILIPKTKKTYKMICIKCKGKLKERFDCFEVKKKHYTLIAGVCKKCEKIYVMDIVELKEAEK